MGSDATSLIPRLHENETKIQLKNVSVHEVEKNLAVLVIETRKYMILYSQKVRFLHYSICTTALVSSHCSGYVPAF